MQGTSNEFRPNYIAFFSFKKCENYMSLVVRKPVFGVLDQVLHKPGCTATEDSERHEILYI